MSIAVLRTFIEKRKEEHEAMLNKKRKKPEQRAVKEDSMVSAVSKEEGQVEPAKPKQDKMNGEGKKEVDAAVNDGKKTSNWEKAADIQPPVVLEVSQRPRLTKYRLYGGVSRDGCII
jgi:tRNA (guanine26-N2/guanine27-N2)-dimethyltransferase